MWETITSPSKTLAPRVGLLRPLELAACEVEARETIRGHRWETEEGREARLP